MVHNRVNTELADAASAAGIKVAPAVAVVGASAAGWGVQEWMYGATLLYVVLQGAYLVWKWVREARKPK